MFEVTYHKKVVDDVSVLPSSIRNVIKKTIEGKLNTEPEFFGKPLQFSLSGLRSLRVGDYRVIFQLKKKEVFVVIVGHRSVVYANAEKRV